MHEHIDDIYIYIYTDEAAAVGCQHLKTESSHRGCSCHTGETRTNHFKYLVYFNIGSTPTLNIQNRVIKWMWVSVVLSLALRTQEPVSVHDVLPKNKNYEKITRQIQVAQVRRHKLGRQLRLPGL